MGEEHTVGDGYRILKGRALQTRRSKRGREGEQMIEAKPDDDVFDELGDAVKSACGLPVLDKLVANERAATFQDVPKFLSENAASPRLPLAIVKVPGVDSDRAKVFAGMLLETLVVVSVADAGPNASGAALLRAMQTRQAHLSSSKLPVICIEDGEGLSSDLLRETVAMAYNGMKSGCPILAGIVVGVGESGQPIQDCLTIREIAMTCVGEFALPQSSAVLEKSLTAILPARNCNVIFGSRIVEQIRQEFSYSFEGVRHTIFVGSLAHLLADDKAMVPSLQRWHQAFGRLWLPERGPDEHSLIQLQEEILKLSVDDDFIQLVANLPSVMAAGGLPGDPKECTEAIVGWLNEWLAFRLLSSLAERALFGLPPVCTTYNRLAFHEIALRGLSGSAVLESATNFIEKSPVVDDALLVSLGDTWENLFMSFAGMVAEVPEISGTELAESSDLCISIIRSLNQALRDRPIDQPLSPNSKVRLETEKAAALLKASRSSRQRGNLRFGGDDRQAAPGLSEAATQRRKLASSCISSIAGLVRNPCSLALHEVFFFDDVEELLTLRGTNGAQPWQAIYGELRRKDCPTGDVFDGLQRFGRTANVNRWFASTLDYSKKMKDLDVMNDYSRFARSVKELSFCGIVKKSSTRRDHVDRLAFPV